MYWCSSSASSRGRRLVVSERLLHHDASRSRQTGLGQALDDRAEQERRDLQVEDGTLGALDRVADPLVRRRVAEVAVHVRQPRGEPVEHRRVDRLAGALDRLAGALAPAGPRVQSSTATPTIGQSSSPRALQPVQRPERHHLGQVAGDPEDHEDVRGALIVLRGWSRTGVVWLSIVMAIVTLPWRDGPADRSAGPTSRATGSTRRGPSPSRDDGRPHPRRSDDVD